MYQQRTISPFASLGLLDLPAFGKARGIQGKRPLEKEGAQFVIGRLLGGEADALSYTVHGKPVLKNRVGHISISHSHDRLAVLFNSSQPVGVDIELIREKVLNIRHKFLNEEELNAAGTDVEQLITYWAAKESLYKVYGEKELDFSRDLFVKPLERGRLLGEIRTQELTKSFLLAEEKLDNYKLVFVLNEIQEHSK